MYAILVTLPDGMAVRATRPTREAADKYEKLCRTNGVSAGGRWFNPSNIIEVTINEQPDPPSVVEADPGATAKPTQKRKARPPVRGGSK